MDVSVKYCRWNRDYDFQFPRKYQCHVRPKRETSRRYRPGKNTQNRKTGSAVVYVFTLADTELSKQMSVEIKSPLPVQVRNIQRLERLRCETYPPFIAAECAQRNCGFCMEI